MINKLSDTFDQTINPATEDKQDVILQGINKLLEGPGSNIRTYSTQKITINGDGVAKGTSEAAVLVHITHTNTNATYLRVTSEDENASANDFLLPTDVIFGPIPITNADQLKIYGTAADTVHLLLVK